MIEFYCSRKKRGDRAVIYCGSNVCPIEVHSSPFVATIRKLVYGIIDLLGLVKAHKIDDCKLVGFALPKIKCQRCIVKVTVICKCALQKFKCDYEKICAFFLF